MVKKTTLSRTSRKTKKTGPPRNQIAATIAAMKQIKPTSAKAAKVISLLNSWLSDESGYDEEAWPQLKKALDEERVRVGARRLLHG